MGSLYNKTIFLRKLLTQPRHVVLQLAALPLKPCTHNQIVAGSLITFGLPRYYFHSIASPTSGTRSKSRHWPDRGALFLLLLALLSTCRYGALSFSADRASRNPQDP